MSDFGARPQVRDRPPLHITFIDEPVPSCPLIVWPRPVTHHAAQSAHAHRTPYASRAPRIANVTGASIKPFSST
jgi:hypothetical protein